MPPLYHLSILDGSVGLALGINELGQVVGSIVMPNGDDESGAWWVPVNDGPGVNYSQPALAKAYGLDTDTLIKIDVDGNAIPGLFNINQTMPIFSNVPGIAGTGYDLNNVQQIVGERAIYTFSFSGWTSIPIPDLNGLSCIGFGINDLGDVVGRSYDPVSGISKFGFYLPNGSMATISAAPDGATCGLYDINNSKLAVGYMDSVPVPTQLPVSSFPCYVDCTAASLQPVRILVPGEQLDQAYGCATAVNSGGTIVGYVESGLRSGQSPFPFVYEIGQNAAWDLNQCLNNNPKKWINNNLQGWSLEYAWDINDKGQIVGMTTRGSDVAGFVATPINPPVEVPTGSSPLSGTLRAAIGGLMLLALPPGGWGALWESLPLEQREALLSFAISNLAGRMTDGEARAQIQSIAAAAASRALAQAIPPQRPAPTAAQIAKIAEIRDRMRRR